MKQFFRKNKYKQNKVSGFVLPFTLFICGIMLLISLGISTVLEKQIFFSQVARDSQAAYYAADDAVACVISIDETYINATGTGIFPSDAYIDSTIDMESTLDYVNDHRVASGYKALASTLNEIKCAQSVIFDTNAPSYFEVSTTTFVRTTPSNDIEEGKTSTFKMKMNIGDGVYRCAKVTVNKTETYRQIIAQGYAACDRASGSIERAVVNTTLLN